MSDISGELAKRISRRQFLFGGANRSGRGSEAGVLGSVLGVAGIGIGVMALSSPGPNAQSFTDKYATIASLNRRLNVNVIDEFVGGSTEAGEIGEMGWNAILSGSGTIVQGSVLNHPGFFVCTSGLTANSYALIQNVGAPFSPGDDNDFYAIVRYRAVGSGLDSVLLRFGLISESPGAETQVTVFEYDPFTFGDTNWMTVTSTDYVGLGREEVTDTGIPLADNTWYRLRIVTSSTQRQFYIDDVLKATHTTILPATQKPIQFGCKNYEAATKRFDVDFFQYLATVTR